MPERTRVALRILEQMTLRPREIDAAFADALRADGLDDEAIREAANVGFHYNLINRVADAFDFPVPEGASKIRLAKMLNFAGKRLKGKMASEPWVLGADGVPRPTELDLGRAHMLTTTSETTPELRQAVEAFVVAEWGVTRPDAPALPADLEGYLKKLSRSAYKIVDEDIEALRAAGYNKDAIYDVTMVGSFAAALVGIESLFGALYG